MCLSLYDLSGIQRYIFGSNRLRENIGASHLVQQALDVWLREAASAKGVNVEWSGGGNALVRSPDEATARRVAGRFSAHLHERAPGLSVACGHAPWDGQASTFSASFKAAGVALDRDKTGRAPAAAFDGAGVTAQCASTGEPALRRSSRESDKREESRWEGPATVAKLAAVEAARETLEGYFDPGELLFPADLDWLGRTRGESSFIGIIHVDGNGMGKRFKDAADRRDGGQAMRDLSAHVRTAGTATLKGALEWVSLQLGHFQDPKKGGFQLFQKNGTTYFPVRPIVFGGDDITLVCEGRIALDLAARLLELWHENTAKEGIADCHACAGVALTKSHYPFFRAYELAAELCCGAKTWLTSPTNNSIRGSALDYEIAAGGALLSLDDRRRQDVASGGGKERLHVRPYLVVGEPPLGQPYRKWSWFRRELLGALQQEPSWKDFRTQLHALAPVLREGSEATSELFRQWQHRFGPERALPIPEGAGLSVSGFTNGETPYLDAIELLDMLVYPVPEKEGAK